MGRIENSDELIKNIEVGIIQASNFNDLTRKATVLMPASTYAEINGTIVNFAGRVQRLRPAVATIEQERLPGEFAVSRLDKFGAHNDKWTRGTKFNARPVWNVLTQLAKAYGHDFEYDTTEDVFDDIAKVVPELSGLDYERVGNHGAAVGEAEVVV